MIIKINKIINKDKTRADLKGWRLKLKELSNKKELVKLYAKMGKPKIRF